jgi:hypothetical protein
MMASSLAVLRGRGGGALGSDRFQYVVADHTNHRACYDCKKPCLQTWRMRSLAVWSRNLAFDKMRRPCLLPTQTEICKVNDELQQYKIIYHP